MPKFTRIPIDHRRNSTSDLGFSSGPAASFSDMVFGFLEDPCYEESLASSGEYDHQRNEVSNEEDEEEKEKKCTVDEDKSFWENQHQLLQATLCRTSSLESNIRSMIKEAIKETQMTGTICSCGSPTEAGCRICLMRELSGHLRNAGYNSAICKSKWRKSPDIPSGEHTFIDVVDDSSSKKGEIRVIIELNFRSEFEMAKASEEYNRLVRRLPEVFVGKIERLNNVIKVMCLAAKKCMKEKKMHLGPWRKSRYMQAKWLGTSERVTTMSMAIPLSMGFSGRPTKPKASMLTVDLLDVMLNNMHSTAVEVV